MPNQEDYLDRVWIKVINLDPNGSWIEECMSQTQDVAFEGVGEALKRIVLYKPSFERLGRLFRFVRYGACSAAFRALEGPGLKRGRVYPCEAGLVAARPNLPCLPAGGWPRYPCSRVPRSECGSRRHADDRHRRLGRPARRAARARADAEGRLEGDLDP